MRGKTEMEGRCVEDDLDWESFFRPNGTPIIHMTVVFLITEFVL